MMSLQILIITDPRYMTATRTVDLILRYIFAGSFIYTRDMMTK